MIESSEISSGGRIVIITGNSLPTGEELRAMVAAMIPPGMEIITGGNRATINGASPTSQETEIERWNARVDEAKAARIARRAAK